MAENIIPFTEKHLETIVDTKSRLKTIEIQVCDLSDMKENLKVLTYLQEKQEARDIKFDSIYEQQIKTNTEVTMALKSINSSLNNLNDEIKQTNSKVTSLETKFNISESKSTIDIRDWLKKVLLKFIFPTTVVGFLLFELAKSLKIIK